MLRYIYLLLICFITTVSTSAFLNKTEISKLADKICDIQCRSDPDQQLILLIFDCENEKNVEVAPLPKTLEIMISVDGVRYRGNRPYKNLVNLVYSLLMTFALYTLLSDLYQKYIKPFESASFNLYVPSNESVRDIRTVGSYNAESLDSVRFTKVLTINKSDDLEAGNISSSIMDIYIIEYGTTHSNTLRSSSRDDTSVVLSVEEHRVQEINSTNSLALVENNDFRVRTVNRRITHLMESVRSERNLSRSVSQMSLQSNYSLQSFETASYSSESRSETEFHQSVNSSSIPGGASSARALSPDFPLRKNERVPYHLQLRQVPRSHCDIRASPTQEATINGEYSRAFEIARLSPLSGPSDSHENLSQFFQSRSSQHDAVPHSEEPNGTHTPLPVARMDRALRNIGGIRSVRNDEEQNSESDYSFPTASLHSDDASSLGSSVNSSRSNLSNDSGITNSRSDVENMINE